MSSASVVFAVLVALTIILVGRALLGAPRRAERPGMCSGPHNVGLYDAPYEHYPRYEGRGATWWDGDRRCMTSCGQSPCTIWCR
jgi:hypothetical protein